MKKITFLALAFSLISCINDAAKERQIKGFDLVGRYVIINKDTLQIISVEHYGYTLNLSNKTWIAITDTGKFNIQPTH